jgi:3',5'-nucleoside bisphosphate phosphatase
MKSFRADLHIHTVLSPCGDLEMSPLNIIKKALETNLDILGVTDHNTTRHAALMQELGQENGVFVLTGAEVTSREEVHCLVFFENDACLKEFQNYLDFYLPEIPNDPGRFGYQPVVDRHENILMQEERMLMSAIDQGIDQLEKKVHELNGLFIPAHVDRERYSLSSQLGFIPPDINADALEISRFTNRERFYREHPSLGKFTLLRSSDAHTPGRIGEIHTEFLLETPSFREIRMALGNLDGRKILN